MDWKSVGTDHWFWIDMDEPDVLIYHCRECPWTQERPRYKADPRGPIPDACPDCGRRCRCEDHEAPTQ